MKEPTQGPIEQGRPPDRLGIVTDVHGHEHVHAHGAPKGPGQGRRIASIFAWASAWSVGGAP